MASNLQKIIVVSSNSGYQKKNSSTSSPPRLPSPVTAIQLSKASYYRLSQGGNFHPKVRGVKSSGIAGHHYTLVAAVNS